MQQLLAPQGQASETGSDVFLLERAATEHEVAERKREATLSKAGAVATLAAALVAILAAPAFEASNLGTSTRWILLSAVVAFLAAILLAAVALWSPVEPGDRPSREELDNWTTHRFQTAEARLHVRDFTEMYVLAAQNVRKANETAQAWLTRAVVAVGIGLLLLLLTLAGELA